MSDRRAPDVFRRLTPEERVRQATRIARLRAEPGAAPEPESDIREAAWALVDLVLANGKVSYGASDRENLFDLVLLGDAAAVEAYFLEMESHVRTPDGVRIPGSLLEQRLVGLKLDAELASLEARYREFRQDADPSYVLETLRSLALVLERRNAVLENLAVAHWEAEFERRAAASPNGAHSPSRSQYDDLRRRGAGTEARIHWLRRAVGADVRESGSHFQQAA